MNLINVTHRPITIVDNQGNEVLTLNPSGVIVGASIQPEVLEVISTFNEEIEIVTYRYTDISGLPDPKPDTMYVVTYAVLQALEDSRIDVIAPDTSPTSIIRQNGRVIGVQRLRKL